MAHVCTVLFDPPLKQDTNIVVNLCTYVTVQGKLNLHMCVVTLCTAQENVTASGGQGDRQEQHTVSSWGCVCV